MGRILRQIAILISITALSTVAAAHDSGISSVVIRIDEKKMTVAGSFAVAEISKAIPTSNRDESLKAARSIFTISSGDDNLEPTEVRVSKDGPDGLTILHAYEISPANDLRFESSRLSDFRAGHLQFVSIESDGEIVYETTLEDGSTGFELDAAFTRSSALSALIYGVRHVLSGWVKLQVVVLQILILKD